MTTKDKSRKCLNLVQNLKQLLLKYPDGTTKKELLKEINVRETYLSTLFSILESREPVRIIKFRADILKEVLDSRGKGEIIYKLEVLN